MRPRFRGYMATMREQDPARGARIASLRERAHQTQEALSREIGVSTRTYQHWESGQPIRPANLRRLAEVLGTTPEFIDYGRDQDGHPAPDRLAGIERRLRDLEQLVRDQHEETRREFTTARDELTKAHGEFTKLTVREHDMLDRLEELVRRPPRPEAAQPEGDLDRRRRAGGRDS